MYVIHAPDGGEERRWDYKPDDLPYEEAELLEETLNITFEEFKGKVVMGGARARRALLWVLLRRDTPGIRFTDVQLKRAGELTVEFDADEISSMRDAAMKADLTEDERRQFLAALDVMDADAIERVSAEVPKETPAGPSGTSD